MYLHREVDFSAGNLFLDKISCISRTDVDEVEARYYFKNCIWLAGCNWTVLNSQTQHDRIHLRKLNWGYFSQFSSIVARIIWCVKWIFLQQFCICHIRTIFMNNWIIIEEGCLCKIGIYGIPQNESIEHFQQYDCVRKNNISYYNKQSMNDFLD